MVNVAPSVMRRANASDEETALIERRKRQIAVKITAAREMLAVFWPETPKTLQNSAMSPTGVSNSPRVFLKLDNWLLGNRFLAIIVGCIRHAATQILSACVCMIAESYITNRNWYIGR